MRNDLTLKIHRDGEWFIGSCPEVPAANGQGRSLMACSRNLVQAIALLLDEEDEPSVATTTTVVDVLGRSAKYTVQLIQSWEGWSVNCPDLPGCFSQGDDEEEALANIRDAIKDYVEVAEEIKGEAAAHLTKVA